MAAPDPGIRAACLTPPVAGGVAVGLLVSVLDPQSVIVGGGLGLSEGPYWESFCVSAREHIWSEVHRDIPILRAATGTDAGIIGAAAKALEQVQE